jgi:hypothetical protein
MMVMVRSSLSWILGVAVTAVVCGNTAAAAPAVLGEQTLADVGLGRTTVVARPARLAAAGAPAAIAAIPLPRPNPLRSAGAAAPGTALVLDDRRMDAIGAGLGLIDFKGPLLLIAGNVARTNAAVLNLPAPAAGKGVVSLDAPANGRDVVRIDQR